MRYLTVPMPASITGSCILLITGSSTIAAWHEDLITAGACGYAAVEGQFMRSNRVTGGTLLPRPAWLGQGETEFFHLELKRLGRKNRVRVAPFTVLFPSGIKKH